MATITKSSSAKVNIRTLNVRTARNVKNLTIGFSDQPGEIWSDNPQGHTTISGGMVTASGIALRLSNNATISTTLSGTGDSGGGDQFIATFTLASPTNQRLFGFHNTTAYQDSVSATNVIPAGANVTASDYQLLIWTDWGQTDNYNIVHQVFLRNLDASEKSIIIYDNARYVIHEGSN